MNEPRFFELQADDPARAATFYRAVFACEITRDEAMPIDYWRVDTRGGLEGAILKRPAAAARAPRPFRRGPRPVSRSQAHRRERQHLCEGVVVAVEVQHGGLVLLCAGTDQQVGDRHSMLT
jgi:hypothetical protein